jgi:hypothetical protein
MTSVYPLWIGDYCETSVCGCCDPGFALDSINGVTVWWCSHGTWQVTSAMITHPPEHCPGNCADHPMYSNDVAELFNENSNASWGDIWWDSELARVCKLTPEQAAAEEAAAAAAASAAVARLAVADEARRIQLKSFTMAKTERDATEHVKWAADKARRTGAVDVCRFHTLLCSAKAKHAAEGDACLKSLLNYNGPRGDARTITVADALEGCHNHAKGKCPFRHGEEATAVVVPQFRQFNLGPSVRAPPRTPPQQQQQRVAPGAPSRHGNRDEFQEVTVRNRQRATHRINGGW